MNGEMLRPENGYPARIVIPGWEANMWIKWLRRIEVGDEPWHHREETSKYTDLLENGKARRFTFVMDAKSVITEPEPAGAAEPQSRLHGALRASPGPDAARSRASTSRSTAGATGGRRGSTGRSGTRR